MIPHLTFDREAAKKAWPDYTEEQIDNDIAKYAVAVNLSEHYDVEAHVSDECFGNLGIYKEIKKLKTSPLEYGYASTQDALAKYLSKYGEGPDKKYYIYAHMLSMDYEKYYKFGSYINNDGVNTGDDYDWDSDDEQQFENEWIAFCVYEVIE